MGNNSSIHPKKATQCNDCLICLEKINDVFCIKCNICNIYLHDKCDRKYRKQYGYTMTNSKCPHCGKKGELINHSDLNNGKNKKNAVYNELMNSFIEELELDL
jgi:hypothetical protein